MELKELHELRKSGEPIYAKNKTRTTITANDDRGRFELGPAGSEDSVKQIPNEKLGLSGLQALIRKGDVEVGREEIFVESLRSSDDIEKNTSHTGLDVVVEEDKSSKDLVEKTCLITGKKVFQTVEEVRSEVPPLHPTVADRAGEFVVSHKQREDGGFDVTWNRVQIG